MTVNLSGTKNLINFESKNSESVYVIERQAAM